MVTGRVGQGAAFATPVAATRHVKAATIQCLNILSLFVDFGMPLAGRRVRLQSRQLLTAPLACPLGPPMARIHHFFSVSRIE
jgi:hypothetical protein